MYVKIKNNKRHLQQYLDKCGEVCNVVQNAYVPIFSSTLSSYKFAVMLFSLPHRYDITISPFFCKVRNHPLCQLVSQFAKGLQLGTTTLSGGCSPE